MSKTLFTLTLIASLGLLAAAQDSRVSPPLTARDNTQVMSAQPGTQSVMKMGSSFPPFCHPKVCLYYAGDFDSKNPNSNGLFNANNPGQDMDGQVWVGVKPPRTATVTGGTFNEFFSSSEYSGTNPTPFQTQINIVEGAGGTVVCNTSGTATMQLYGDAEFGLAQYSYTIKKLKKTCKIQAGSKGATYVNLLPTSNNGFGFLVNVEDAKPRYHRGWKNDLDDCYFNSSSFGYSYSTCISQGTFDEFSIALTGKEKR